MAKKPSNKEIMDRSLTELNEFMKDFGIESINFGKTHSIERTKGKKAKDIVRNKKSGK